LIVALGVLLLLAMMALVFVTDALSTLHATQTADLQEQADLVARELMNNYINYNLMASDPSVTPNVDTNNDGTPDAAQIPLPPGLADATAAGFRYAASVQTFLLSNRIHLNAHGDQASGLGTYQGAGSTPYEVNISRILQSGELSNYGYNNFTIPGDADTLADEIVWGVAGRYTNITDPPNDPVPPALPGVTPSQPAVPGINDDPDKLPNPMWDHADNDGDGSVDEAGEDIDEPAEFNQRETDLALSQDTPFGLVDMVDILLDEPFQSRLELMLANNGVPVPPGKAFADVTGAEDYRHLFTTEATSTIINEITGQPRLGLNWVAHRLAVDLCALRIIGDAGGPGSALAYQRIAVYLEAATELRDALEEAFSRFKDHADTDSTITFSDEEARRRANQVTVNILDFLDDDVLSRTTNDYGGAAFDPTNPDDRYLNMPKILYDLGDSIAVKDWDGALYQLAGGALDTPVLYNEPVSFDDAYFGVDRHAFVNELYVINRERNGIDDEHAYEDLAGAPFNGDWVQATDDLNGNALPDPDWDTPAGDANGDLCFVYDPEGSAATGIDAEDLVAGPDGMTPFGEENVYFIELANIYPEPLDVTGYKITYTKKDGSRSWITLDPGSGGERFIIPPADYTDDTFPSNWDFGYLVISSHASDFDAVQSHLDLEFGRDNADSVFLRAPLPPGATADDVASPIYGDPVVPTPGVWDTAVVDRQKVEDGVVKVQPDLPLGYLPANYPASLIEQLVSHSVERIDPRVAWVAQNNAGLCPNWEIPGWGAGPPAEALANYDFHTIADLPGVAGVTLHDNDVLGNSQIGGGDLTYRWDNVQGTARLESVALGCPFGTKNSQLLLNANLDWLLSYQYKMPSTDSHDTQAPAGEEDYPWNRLGPRDLTLAAAPVPPAIYPWAFPTVAALGDILALPGAVDVDDDDEYGEDDVYYTNVPVFPDRGVPPPSPSLGPAPVSPVAPLPESRVIDPYHREYGFLYDHLTVTDPLHDGLDNDCDWQLADDQGAVPDGRPSRDWDGPLADANGDSILDYDPENNVDESDEVYVEGKVNINVETGETLGFGTSPYTVEQRMIIGAGAAILMGLPYADSDFFNSIIDPVTGIIPNHLGARPFFKRMFDVVNYPLDAAGRRVAWPRNLASNKLGLVQDTTASTDDDDGDLYRDEQDERYRPIGAIMNLITTSYTGGNLRSRPGFYGIQVTVLLRDPTDTAATYDPILSPPPVASKTVLAIVVSVPGTQPRILFTVEPSNY